MKTYIRIGNDVYEKEGRWYCSIWAWAISPAKKDGAILEGEV